MLGSHFHVQQQQSSLICPFCRPFPLRLAFSADAPFSLMNHVLAGAQCHRNAFSDPPGRVSSSEAARVLSVDLIFHWISSLLSLTAPPTPVNPFSRPPLQSCQPEMDSGRKGGRVNKVASAQAERTKRSGCDVATRHAYWFFPVLLFLLFEWIKRRIVQSGPIWIMCKWRLWRMSLASRWPHRFRLTVVARFGSVSTVFSAPVLPFFFSCRWPDLLRRRGTFCDGHSKRHHRHFSGKSMQKYPTRSEADRVPSSSGSPSRPECPRWPSPDAP